MEIWERSTALDALGELLVAGSRGGCIVLVAGEAGIGKSTLVNEFVRQCGTRARVLRGGCDRLTTPRTLGPLQDISRLTGGLLADRLERGADQNDTFAAFLDEVSGRHQLTRPVVVVVEDVHWADQATLDWLVFFGRRVDRLPILLVVTYRDDEIGADHPLRGSLAALPHSIVRRLPLQPLSRSCVAEQAKLAGRDADVLFELSGGNPLFVTELLKSAGGAVPVAAQNLILDRLRTLPPSARDFAQLVAVIPTRADTEFMQRWPEQVEICVDAGVLTAAEEGASYRHELLRSAVEDSLSPPRRTELHRRVLDVLLTVEHVDPGRLTHHAVNAKDSSAVLKYATLAGAAAARQGAHREANAHYRAAIAHADRLPAADRADLLEAYASEAYLAGQMDDCLQGSQAALAIREDLGQIDRMGENLRWISRSAWHSGREDFAREEAARAIAVLETLPSGRQLAMAYSNLSQLHMTAYSFEQAITWGEKARDLAEKIGDEETAIHATINISSSRLASGDLTAQHSLLEVHERAAALGLVEHAARALANAASNLGDELGENSAAAPLLDRALNFAMTHELDGHIKVALTYRALNNFERGDWVAALADAGAALACPGATGPTTVTALVVQGRIEAARGHGDPLGTLDEAARLSRGSAELQTTGQLAIARSEYFFLKGDYQHAAAEVRRCLEQATSLRQSYKLGELAFRLWRAGGTEQIPTEIAEPYRLMIEGDWKAAATEWERRGNVYAHAQALSLGDRDAVIEALRILDGLGAVRVAEHLRSELRQRGVPRVPRGPSRSTAASPIGLTARQADILELIAEGLPNAEIAARLSLSAKTVEHHTSAVLGKLGVANRTQAAAAAHRLGLTK